MISQTRIQHFPKCTTLRVVVDALRVYESGNAAFIRFLPREWKKTFKQIRLLSFQGRIILHGVQKVLFAGKHFILCKIHAVRMCIFQCRLPFMGGLGSGQFFYSKHGIGIRQHALFVPLDLDPRRVTDHQVKTAALGKYISKLQLPMHKVILLCYCASQPQPGQKGAQFVQVDLKQDVSIFFVCIF